MGLNTIKGTGNWGGAASNLNNNFASIAAEIEKLKAANVKFKGYYTTELTLKAAHPSPTVGDNAWVGAEYPGIVYECKTAGTWSNTAKAPSTPSVQLADYATKNLLDVRTTEYNVSVQHPTSGLDGTNNYTLTDAIALIPVALRTIGLKCSFLNVDGKVETWEYQGGAFTNLESWIQQIRREELTELEENNIKYTDKTVSSKVDKSTYGDAKIRDTTDEFNFCDAYGNIILRVSKRGLETTSYNIIDPVTKKVVGVIDKNFFNKENSIINSKEDVFVFADKDGNVIAEISNEGVKSVAFFDKDGNEIGGINISGEDGTICTLKNGEVASSPVQVHPLYGKEIFVMGTSNDFNWPKYLAQITGSTFDKEKSKYTIEGGTFAGDIGGPLYNEEGYNQSHMSGGSIRAKNFCLLSNSTFDKPNYLFLMTQNDGIEFLDQRIISFSGICTKDADIAMYIGGHKFSISVNTGLTITELIQKVKAVNIQESSWKVSKTNENSITFDWVPSQTNSPNDIISFDFKDSGFSFSSQKITAEEHIKEKIYNSDAKIFSQYIIVETGKANSTDAHNYFKENTAEIVSQFNSPKPFSYVHLKYETTSVEFTITNGCTNDGSIQIKLNERENNVILTNGMSVEDVINKISSDITENFSDTVWDMFVSGNKVIFKYNGKTDKIGSTDDVFLFVTNETGVSVDNNNGIKTTNSIVFPLIYQDRDISQFDDEIKWTYSQAYGDVVGFMKGNIEYIQKNSPFTKIIMYNLPLRNYQSFYRADGTYDIEAQKKSEFTSCYYRAKFTQYLAEYYQIPYINADFTGVLANYEEFYTKQNDVHFNDNMTHRVAEVIANNIKY